MIPDSASKTLYQASRETVRHEAKSVVDFYSKGKDGCRHGKGDESLFYQQVTLGIEKFLRVYENHKELECVIVGIMGEEIPETWRA